MAYRCCRLVSPIGWRTGPDDEQVRTRCLRRCPSARRQTVPLKGLSSGCCAGLQNDTDSHFSTPMKERSPTNGAHLCDTVIAAFQSLPQRWAGCWILTDELNVTRQTQQLEKRCVLVLSRASEEFGWVSAEPSEPSGS